MFVLVGAAAGWLVLSVVGALATGGALRRLGSADLAPPAVATDAAGLAPAWWAGDDGADVAAVVAHSLLGSMAVVAGAAHTLDTMWDTLSLDERRIVTARLVAQTDHVMGILGDVARGLAPEVHDALESGLGAEGRLAVRRQPAVRP